MIWNFVLQVAVSLAFSAYTRRRQKKMQAKAEAEADKRKGFDVPIDGEAIHLPLIYGHQKVGGVRAVVHTADNGNIPASLNGFDGRLIKGLPVGNQEGSKNEFMLIQQAWCFGGIDSLVDVEVDGKNWDEDKFSHHLRYSLNGGTASTMADNFDVPNALTNKFTDIFWADMLFKLDRDDPQYSYPPDVRVYVKGTKIRDIEFSNGAWQFSSNYVFSNNSALVLADYLTRPAIKGGCGISDEGLDLESFAAAKVTCDIAVATEVKVRGRINGVRPVADGEVEPLPAERTVRLYETNITLDTSNTRRENITALVETMAQSELVYSEGVYKLVLDYPSTVEQETALVTASYSDDDIEGEIENVFSGADQKFNRAEVKFSNESLDYKTDSVSWPVRGSDAHNAFLAVDGNIANETSYTLTGGTQRQLAFAKAEEIVRSSRLGSVVKFSIPRYGMVHDVGDLIELNSVAAKIENKLYRITGIQVAPHSLKVSIEAERFDKDTLAWNVEDDVVEPAVVFKNVVIPNVENLTWHTGARTTGINSNGWLTWDAPTSVSVRRYHVFYKTVGGEYEPLSETRQNVFDLPATMNDSTDYYVLVRTETAGGSLSEGALIFLDQLPELAPLSTANVSEGVDSVHLSWTDPTNELAAQYAVYVSTDSNRSNAVYHSSTVGQEIVISPLSVDNYWFWIDVVGADGSTAAMASPVTASAIQMGVQAGQISANTIAWGDLVDDVRAQIDSAGDASASAAAAELFALAANTSANTSANYAAVANGHMMAANTHAGDALVYRNEAAISANTANNHAVSAATASGIAVSTEASLNLTVAAFGLSTFDGPVDAWGNGVQNNPTSINSADVITDDAVFGTCYLFPDNTSKTVTPKRKFPIEPGRTVYAVTVQYRVVDDGAGSPSNPTNMIGCSLYENGTKDATEDNEQRTILDATVADGVRTETVWFTDRQEVKDLPASDTGGYSPVLNDNHTNANNNEIRFHFRQNGSSQDDQRLAVKSFEVRDVTALADALIEADSASAAASAAATSASTANASETAAGQSASAANTSEVNAATSATNAGISETAAVAAAQDANTAAVAAEYSRDVTAQISGSGAFDNPIFANWSGSNPDGMANVSTSEGSLSKVAGKYGNALRFSNTTSSENRPYIQIRDPYSSTSFQNADNNVGLKIEAEITKVSGVWDCGACIRVQWDAGTGGTSRSSYYFLEDFREGQAVGETVHIEFTAMKPDSYVAGSDDGVLKIIIYGVSEHEGRTRANCTWDLHRFSVSEISNSSSAAITQRAIADLEGGALSSIAMRTKAGTANAELELISLSDPNGDASAARISADDIILEGSVRVPHLTVDSFLDIDAIDAGFRMSKTSATDFTNDGLYMGRHEDAAGDPSFGFFAGRTANGSEEYIQMTKEDGLIIKNAVFKIGSGTQLETSYVTSQTISLDANTTSVSFTAVGGGGQGGAGGKIENTPPGAHGSNGQNTTIKLLDGNTIIQTWSASGGQGGRGGGKTSGGYTGSTQSSTLSPYGDGGDGGQGQYAGGDSWSGSAGHHGEAGSTKTVNSYDITGLSDPKLEINIGSGGGSGDRGGEDGAVVLNSALEADLPAGVIAFKPSQSGSFTATNGAVDEYLPQTDPVAGLWTLYNIHRDTSIDVGDGNILEERSYTGPISFISNARPKYSSTASTRTVKYMFWPIG